MSITKAEIIKILTIIQTNYAQAYKDITKSSLSLMADVWYNSLKIYPKDIILKVVQYTLEKNTYPPTLADIINNLKEIVYLSFPNINELWNEILQAVNTTQKLYYFGEQYIIDGVRPKDKLQVLFNNLHEICREWLATPDTLKNMYKLDTTALSCEKARFIKDIPRIMESLWIKNKCEPQLVTKIVNKSLPTTTPKDTGDK